MSEVRKDKWYEVETRGGSMVVKGDAIKIYTFLEDNMYVVHRGIIEKIIKTSDESYKKSLFEEGSIVLQAGLCSKDRLLDFYNNNYYVLDYYTYMLINDDILDNILMYV